MWENRKRYINVPEFLIWVLHIAQSQLTLSSHLYPIKHFPVKKEIKVKFPVQTIYIEKNRKYVYGL